MNVALQVFERASLFGLGALLVALLAQFCLDGRVPATWRVWVWRVALLQTALALVPLAPLRVPVLPARPVAEREADFSKLAHQSVLGATGVTSRSPLVLLPPLMLLPALAYGLGIAVQIGLLGKAHLRLSNTLRSCRPLTAAMPHSLLEKTADCMGVSRRPALWEGPVAAPFLARLWQPVVVLPLDASLLSLETTLCHEMAHLKRRDLAWNSLQWAIQTLLWFHPLVWVARRYLVLEVESACDEMVLASTPVTPKAYGELLLSTLVLEQTPLTVGVSDGYHAMKTRLLRLSHTPQQPRALATFAFALSLAAALGAPLPVRLVARAQAQGEIAKTQGEIAKAPANINVRGVVLDENGEPVVRAAVYAVGSSDRSSSTLATQVTNEKGAFEFGKEVTDKWGIYLFVESPTKGHGQGFVFLGKSDSNQLGTQPTIVRLAPPVKRELTFLGPGGISIPAVNREVGPWRIGPSQNQIWRMPRKTATRFQTTTNLQGRGELPWPARRDAGPVRPRR